MGRIEGVNVIIDTVVINTHADPGRLNFGNFHNLRMLPPALRATSLEEGGILSSDPFEYIWGARGMSRSDRRSMRLFDQN